MSWNFSEYQIFCDESVQDGRIFSNFFGGAIIPGPLHGPIEEELAAEKAALGLRGEVKWQKVDISSLERYSELMNCFFAILKRGDAKMRVMFCKNSMKPEYRGEHRSEVYFKLYYQFIKHSFGLRFMPERTKGPTLRLNFDQFPDRLEKIEQFRGYVAALASHSHLRRLRLKIPPEYVREIVSGEHAILQCVDVITGAMAFRLNGMHLEKAPGSQRRGKRTIAKEKLYKSILTAIRELKPGFNPGITTATDPYPEGRWTMPYRHWSFKAKPQKEHSFEPT